MQVLLLFSGGADSSTLLYKLLSEGHAVSCVAFKYGQKHSKELSCAEELCELRGVPLSLIGIEGFAGSAVSSALLGDAPIPYGHYEEESMKKTVVPNRNMVLLSIAGSIAVSNSFDAIAIGAHSGDHAIYPDCRQNFLTAFETALWAGNWGKRVRVIAPFIDLNKADIIRTGRALGVPYHLTWTCYEGGEKPCGHAVHALNVKKRLRRFHDYLLKIP